MNAFNHKNLLKPRQICFVFLALAPVNKLITYPSFLASRTGGSLWISLIVSLALDVALLFFILAAGKDFGNETFYNTLEASLGKPTAKFAYAVYAVYFFLKALLPLIEQKYYVENTLYEIMPAGITFYPFFLVSFYACIKGLKILGRCCDLTVGVTAAGLILAIFLSIGASDFSFLFPLVQKPTAEIIKTPLYSLIWNSDCLYMLFFLGHYRKEEGCEKKIILSYLVAGVTAAAFILVFFSIYGPIASSQPFALPAATVFSVNATNAARFDYLAVFLLLFAQIHSIILPLFLCVKCVERVLGIQKSLVISIAVNLLAAVATILFSEEFFTLMDFSTVFFSPFFAVVLFLLTPALLVGIKIRQGGKERNEAV